MRSQDEDVMKRDAEAARYLNEGDNRTPKRPSEEDLEEFEEHRFEEEQEQEQEHEVQSEEEEDTDTQQVAAEEDEEAELSDADIGVDDAVERDQEVEQQQLSGSSSGSWESGNEDDDGRGQGSVTVLRETTTDIPVSRLTVVQSDAHRRQQRQKVSLQGQQQPIHRLQV